MEIHPVTPDRWGDLEALFGESGAYSGCWCMWFRLTSRQFAEGAGAGNRRALRALVEEGRVPGLLGYRDGRPVGWVSVGPREEFGRIERSPILKRVDDRPVWSVVCFFVDREHRGIGVAEDLLQAAVDYARRHGAEALEAYPVDTTGRRIPDPSAFTGPAGMFAALGFREVARRSERRPILRLELD